MAEGACEAFVEVVVSLRLPEEGIRQRLAEIHDDVLAHSRHIREPNFRAIHPHDLEFLFKAYDERFFGGLCRLALDGRALEFRLSRRMTRAGGATTRYRSRSGTVSYEIALASSLLFDSFGETDRNVTVCGLPSHNRLEATQRIFEHELVHLTEHLCWGQSDCSAARFQEIAGRLFLHQAHTHNLVTRRERAAESGVRVGSQVTFVFEGQRLTGRVNGITKRVSVLVEAADGVLFSDGRRYKTYYVPIRMVEPVT